MSEYATLTIGRVNGKAINFYMQGQLVCKVLRKGQRLTLKVRNDVRVLRAEIDPNNVKLIGEK